MGMNALLTDTNAVIDVLRVEGDRIAEITTFGPQPFELLGLPSAL